MNYGRVIYAILLLTLVMYFLLTFQHQLYLLLSYPSSNLLENKTSYVFDSKDTPCLIYCFYQHPFDVYRISQFWNCQSSFHFAFCPNPTVFQLLQQRKTHCNTKDTYYLANKILAFCHLCQLHIFATPSNYNMLERRLIIFIKHSLIFLLLYLPLK